MVNRARAILAQLTSGVLAVVWQNQWGHAGEQARPLAAAGGELVAPPGTPGRRMWPLPPPVLPSPQTGDAVGALVASNGPQRRNLQTLQEHAGLPEDLMLQGRLAPGRDV